MPRGRTPAYGGCNTRIGNFDTQLLILPLLIPKPIFYINISQGDYLIQNVLSVCTSTNFLTL